MPFELCLIRAMLNPHAVRDGAALGFPGVIPIAFSPVRQLKIKSTTCQSIPADIAVEGIFADSNIKKLLQSSADNPKRSVQCELRQMFSLHATESPIGSIRLFYP
ncbi:hypothetical protein BBW68_08760 [Candidatus Erwinia dacicola]|uniref:Uncharacterized protein n=1 Tax=Candidatus Erwinia dacicola TaxID=252393 RepID=A0A1E7Z1N2_9GAMM|nr:hypothetical protein BBW68_08760 [Candidatus Erwinia dacicola]